MFIIGDIYKNRMGEEYGIVMFSPDHQNPYPLICVDKDKRLVKFTRKGEYIRGHPSDKDLVNV
jgi:hypothetical protein